MITKYTCHDLGLKLLGKIDWLMSERRRCTHLYTKYNKININYWIRGDLCDDRLPLAVFMLETLKLSKGLAKLGNMFLVMFPGVAKLGNMFQDLCPGSKNVFD